MSASTMAINSSSTNQLVGGGHLRVVSRGRATAPLPTPVRAEMAMWESLREGLDEEMERDPRVMMMGEV